MKHDSKFKLDMSVLRGLSFLAVFAVAIIPNTLFGQTVATSTKDIDPSLEQSPARPGTILDRAKADRQSFIKSRIYDTENNNINTPDVDALSDQIIQVNRQVLLLEINQSIAKTHDEIVYLENIINRLEQRLAETDNNTATNINDFIKDAQLKIDNASSTLDLAQSSSTEILTAEPLGPTLSSLKINILETVRELKESQNLIRQAIIEFKKII
ncbi:MAG: hypothetical protein QG609_115 [Patescibacteria group bacterium]|nr:hypothetical protein [Patescibacteria group bacterium]